MGNSNSFPVLFKCEKHSINPSHGYQDYKKIMNWDEKDYCGTEFWAQPSTKLEIFNLYGKDIYYQCEKCKKHVWYAKESLGK